MRHYNKFLLIGIAAVVLPSCADEFKSDFQVAKPDKRVQYEYLNEYDALKTYIDRNGNPGFKLGMGVTVNDFLKKELVYSLACANFDEVTAGNAMKYNSVVKKDGSMDFSTVNKFVKTAQEAGLTIYGHTLCWHAQQNNEYLNGLIADKVIPGESKPTWELISGADFEKDDASNYQYNDKAITSFTATGQGSGGKGRALQIKNEKVGANDYDCQFFLKFSPAMQEGETYEFSMDVRADAAVSFGTQAHVKPYEYKHWNFFGNVSATKDWTTFTKQITVTKDLLGTGTIAFNLGKNATTYYFDNMKLKKYNEKGNGGPSYDASVITNSNFEAGAVGWGGWGNGSTNGRSKEGEGYKGGYAFTFTNKTAVNFWEAQIAYDLAAPLEMGATYQLKFQAKANKKGSLRAGLQNPNGYKGCGDFPMFEVTTDWVEQNLEVVVTGENATRFLFSYGDFAGTVFVDNITLCRLNPDGGGDQIIPLTPEEKKDTLTFAMNNWIQGMMEACGGYVKAWDAVNEPMSDEKPFELKSDPNHTDKDNFFWQDYLGKDYARVVIKLARQYGGDGLKLFINDYNLEAAYNSNKKCEGLIKMVEYWESDGVTKIDGIGTQMHVSLSLNADQQKKNEDAVVKMYQLLAASGKLIKVSELDMGITDADGNKILTVNITEEQHKAMAAYYKFILQKYFELIPAAQRYGITQWASTDSPQDSSWRKGEPIGLWDLNYYRKHTYAGFAEGLTGK